MSASPPLDGFAVANLVDSAGKLLACRIRFERAGSPPAESGWQPDIPFF
jgi:hypothetical protein